MVRDAERVARIQRALESAGLDALICARASNVLMTTGYWPVTGTALAIVTREGAVAVLAPEDEQAFALDSWADHTRLFKAGSLDTLTPLADAVRPHFAVAARAVELRADARLGIEGGGFDPSTYASGFSYAASLPALIASALPAATASDAGILIDRLRATLTPRELTRVRHACGIACNAFDAALKGLAPGRREHEVADSMRRDLHHPDFDRAGGYVYCMSGPNTAHASAAFQQSTARAIDAGDIVLLHCNSCLGGFWTDITRTVSVGEAPQGIHERFEAIRLARQAAIDAVQPGVCASAVDRAARDVMTRSGFGAEFVHATGHGVGFASIDHLARPRIHPRSDDVLETGMVFNIEPGAYVSGLCGLRHCDMVAVAESGAELLTPCATDRETL